MGDENIAKAYHIWKSGTMSNLSLDDILQAMKVTHLELRRYMRKHGHTTCYTVTSGMCDEILLNDLGVAQASRMYYLTPKDIQSIFYRDVSDTGAKIDLAEFTDKVKDGWSNADLAAHYCVSEPRVSQLKRQAGLIAEDKKAYKRLRPEERNYMRNLSAKYTAEELAAKFDVGIATVYRVLANG